MNNVLTKDSAYENLLHICKKISPWPSGSVNAQKAMVAIAKMLKESGADSVYLQELIVP